MNFLSIDSLRDFEVLGDTPIGYLAVVPWGGGAAVAVMHEGDRARIKRIIYQLSPGENPLNAIYGKRTFEQKAVAKLYEAQAETAQARTEREKADNRRDLQNELRRHVLNRADGRDALFHHVRLRG